MKRLPREETRARLLGTAEELFLARGYRATNVEAVAAEAGFTTGAVYSNFAGKADLFLAVLEESTERELAAVRDALDAATNDEARLRVFAATMTADPAGWRARVVATLEFLSEARDDPELLARIRASQAVGTKTVAELVAAVCEAVGVEPPVPPAELAEDLLVVIDGLLIRAIYDPDLDVGAAIARSLNTLLNAGRSDRLVELEKPRGRRR